MHVHLLFILINIFLDASISFNFVKIIYLIGKFNYENGLAGVFKALSKTRKLGYVWLDLRNYFLNSYNKLF